MLLLAFAPLCCCCCCCYYYGNFISWCFEDYIVLAFVFAIILRNCCMHINTYLLGFLHGSDAVHRRACCEPEHTLTQRIYVHVLLLNRQSARQLVNVQIFSYMRSCMFYGYVCVCVWCIHTNASKSSISWSVKPFTQHLSESEWAQCLVDWFVSWLLSCLMKTTFITVSWHFSDK